MIKFDRWQEKYLYYGLLVFGLLGTLYSFVLLELILNLKPCSLCAVERFFVILTVLFAVLGLAVYRRNIKIGYLTLLPIVLGFLTSVYHVYLQYFSSHSSSFCTFETEEPSQFWQIFVKASDCSQIQWTFLSMSIPVQALLFFSLLLLMTLGSFVFLLKRSR